MPAKRRFAFRSGKLAVHRIRPVRRSFGNRVPLKEVTPFGKVLKPRKKVDRRKGTEKIAVTGPRGLEFVSPEQASNYHKDNILGFLPEQKHAANFVTQGVRQVTRLGGNPVFENRRTSRERRRNWPSKK